MWSGMPARSGARRMTWIGRAEHRRPRVAFQINGYRYRVAVMERREKADGREAVHPLLWPGTAQTVGGRCGSGGTRRCERCGRP